MLFDPLLTLPLVNLRFVAKSVVQWLSIFTSINVAFIRNTNSKFLELYFPHQIFAFTGLFLLIASLV
jgi:hypothetical protein